MAAKVQPGQSQSLLPYHNSNIYVCMYVRTSYVRRTYVRMCVCLYVCICICMGNRLSSHSHLVLTNPLNVLFTEQRRANQNFME